MLCNARHGVVDHAVSQVANHFMQQTEQDSWDILIKFGAYLVLLGKTSTIADLLSCVCTPHDYIALIPA
jgi:hypothetical protein